MRATLGRLSLMSLDELQLLVDPDKSAATPVPAPVPQPAARAPLWRRTPLALPTASLLMAFSLNPVVPGHQYAAHAVERLPDRTTRLAGMAA